MLQLRLCALNACRGGSWSNTVFGLISTSSLPGNGLIKERRESLHTSTSGCNRATNEWTNQVILTVFPAKLHWLPRPPEAIKAPATCSSGMMYYVRNAGNFRSLNGAVDIGNAIQSFLLKGSKSRKKQRNLLKGWRVGSITNFSQYSSVQPKSKSTDKNRFIDNHIWTILFMGGCGRRRHLQGVPEVGSGWGAVPEPPATEDRRARKIRTNLRPLHGYLDSVWVTRWTK